MNMIWGVFLVALAISHFGYGLPIGSTPQTYPHYGIKATWDSWTSQTGFYALVPAIGFIITAIGILIGCTWCYRHKDCKQNRGADNQIFVASATLQDARRSQPPDSGFSEPANNNFSEDNNNGPISLREMQNIANNNATAYIISENEEERNRISRESLVEFEPLPTGIVTDPLERYADWFGDDDFPRNRLQYLREIGRGWFGRVVEGEIDDEGTSTTVAVKILNQNASLEDKARFLEQGRLYRDVSHENVLGFIAKCVNEDPWIMIYDLCPMDLQQYLVSNRSNMAALNETGVPLRLMCDVTAGLAHLHSLGIQYGNVWTEAVLVKGDNENARAVLGNYIATEAPHYAVAPESARDPTVQSTSSDVWSLGSLIWQVCAGGNEPPPAPPPPPPCVYRTHLYQVMQLCWNPNPGSRPSSSQVHALINHLYSSHLSGGDNSRDNGTGDFEDRWQRLKPNTIPVVDEHVVALVHAPSTSTASHFTGSDHEFDHPTTQDTLSVDIDTAVSRSSSIMSDKDPLSVQIKSESLTNLHGSLEDVRNIYLTHNEMAVLECHQGNISLEERIEKEQDRSDSSMDPWLKDIIAGSQDDVSYYKDVSDVIKNLDNILNSEKTSSSESSHQASPSRDNLSLDCKKDYPMQSSMVKSPGIINFQNFMDSAMDSKTPENERCEEDDVDRDTLGTLSHSYERHSDSLSQQTLENITPETPIKDLDVNFKICEEENALIQVTGNVRPVTDVEVEIEETELPKQSSVVNSDSKIPKLKELCLASKPSISETKHEEMNDIQDCERSCDNKLADKRTDDKKSETKSIFDVVKSEDLIENVMDLDQKSANLEVDNLDVILPDVVTDVADKRYVDSDTMVTTDTLELKIDSEFSTTQESLHVSLEHLESDANEDIMASRNMITDIETSHHSLLGQNANAAKQNNNSNEITETIEFKLQAPESVQIVNNSEEVAPILSPTAINKEHDVITEDKLLIVSSPEEVQNFVNEAPIDQEETVRHDCDDIATSSSEIQESEAAEETNNSTVYMDLTKTNIEVIQKQVPNEDMKNVINTCLESSNVETACDLAKNESTIYMDLPSMIKETDTFLQSERIVSSHNKEVKDFCSSTPVGSEYSKHESSTKLNEVEFLSETKVPDCEPDSGSKLEQRYVPDNLTPFESPTKSHHTDTYDENSSVVLGPFENYTLELFRGAKSGEIDLPKEELLAFSSNFSEINLETPSPLCDGRFLMEVPDIIHDDMQFDDIETVSEVKIEEFEPATESNSNKNEGEAGSENRISPLTPPNSPGNFLTSGTQQNYIVDIDLDPPAGPSNAIVDSIKEVDLNQIELQITAKLAMAENENNLNIEYSGPLSIEGMSEESILLPDPPEEEAYLAGNASSCPRNVVDLDDECVQALRNELELKLPLAQVSNIEPPSSSMWTESLPPPELIVSYPGALSPIAEETKQQLAAYNNSANCSECTAASSSSSYPEPCGDDTAPPTSSSPPLTYTLRHDNLITMSADSLNGSPCKKPPNDSPIDDKTYTKPDDEKEFKCERLSQVSPFILSPTTDTSVPDNSDYVDNPTGVSTLSKTTMPTDAKLSKPSEPQCLSKATSIDSWCSNDTLYNVEENFDDLVMDPEFPQDLEAHKDDEHSDSSRTLTHHDEDKEFSHCSTYIVHDSKSEACDTFSPDSITANDNYTYTKARADAAETTPTNITKSDIDSAKNTQTKDLAYGTLMSGLPSYSNCTTEVASAFDDVWKLQQPELVRRSPNMGEDSNFTPPTFTEEKDLNESSPHLQTRPRIKKMDSAEISCLQDNLIDSHNKTEISDSQMLLLEITESPSSQYQNMAPNVTSTPLNEIQLDCDNPIDPIPIELPDPNARTPDLMSSLPNFQTFVQSAELRPQDKSPNIDGTNSQDTDFLLEGESKVNSNRDSMAVTDRTPNYSDFESSALSKPQDVHSRDKSSQSMESGMNSEEFRHFETSVRSRPQDLSCVIDASSLLLNSERRFSALTNSTNADLEQTSQSVNQVNNSEYFKTLDISPPNDTNLIESQNVGKFATTNNFYSSYVAEDDTEQPHSIILTEKDIIEESPNRTYDSHTEAPLRIINHTFDSHDGNLGLENGEIKNYIEEEPKINGVLKETDMSEAESNNVEIITQLDKSQSTEANGTENTLDLIQPNKDCDTISKNSEKLCEENHIKEIKDNSEIKQYATVHFLSEAFEELMESNVDDGDVKDLPNDISQTGQSNIQNVTDQVNHIKDVHDNVTHTELDSVDMIEDVRTNGIHVPEEETFTTVTENFLQNEKKFCQLDSYIPLLSDIRFTGPATEIMSTSFSQDSPTEPASPECEQDPKLDAAAEILKEWDSDSDSHSSNSSSGEFIWKDGRGRETPLVPTTHFQHQRATGGESRPGGETRPDGGAGASGSGSGDSGSGSGSEGDEVEFVPSSWDCRAEPAKSSLRSLEQAATDSKKRVVFKRQKYHCVYEYPREAVDDYPPDFSTYADWDSTSAEEAELGYGQLFGAPNPLDMYPLRSGIAYDYDEDFFISSSARPFESLGIMSTSSQFFPGMHVKGSLLERPLSDDITEHFPPPPSPLPTPTLVQTRTPSLDFTTPDSGVEDITPGSTTTEEEFRKKLPEEVGCWRPMDSGSSSESVSPSSPGEALGGLRHTRDKLKLDLPPSPHLPSPRHNRVFNFVLDKPKRHRITEEKSPETGTTPLVMTDETPVVSTNLPLPKDEELPQPEPTFSTFGKSTQKTEPEQQSIILTDETESEKGGEVKPESPKVVEAVKGEGTVLDSGDEDSGIESSSKATLERNPTPNVS